jgi:hypothetical protein
MMLRAAQGALVAAVVAAVPAAAADTGSAGRGDPHGELNVIPIVGLGMLPSWSVGVAPYLGVRWPSLSLALEAHVLFGVDEAAVGIAAAETAIVLVVPSVCGHARAFFLCGLMATGELRAGGEEAISTLDPWLLGIGGRAGVEWFVAPSFALRAFAQGALVAARPILTVNRVKAWEGSPLIGTFGLGFMIPLGGP